MRKIFTLLFLTTLFFNCSSDDSNDVLTDDDGITDEDNTLLTISRGAGTIPGFSDEVKDFTVEAIITDEEGIILTRSFLEFDSEIKLEAEYDKSKTYDLHFVERYLESNTSNPEFSYEDVLTYNVITLLDVKNRLYTYDAYSQDTINSLTKTGNVELEFNNIPSYSSGILGYSYGGAFSTIEGVLDNTETLDVSIGINSTNTVYCFVGSEEESDIRFIKEELTDGQSLVFNFEEMSKTTPIDIEFPPLNNQTKLPFFYAYSINGFDESSNTRAVLADKSIFDNYFSSAERVFIPNNAFEKYTISSIIDYSNFIVETRRVYDNIDEISKKHIPSSLNAEITNNSFPNVQAKVSGEYDYFVVGSYYNDGADFYSDTKRLKWTIYGEASSEISIRQKNLVSNLILEKDNFEIPSSDLIDSMWLTVLNSGAIINYDNYINYVINRNMFTDIGGQNIDRWTSKNFDNKATKKGTENMERPDLWEYTGLDLENEYFK
ncbi:hypothetical protein [Aquimarina algicola]|uniref:Uncharacterized protein n=1 Tax=Aquimarina algicola TaxID=2589995 RepID=A0A504JIY2_9FLAO|nr:hypothetical protein [Aquimarina algicola]TPN88722.1 hypothetical protein FHK87_00470 [Aquimarina algicola]